MKLMLEIIIIGSLAVQEASSSEIRIAKSCYRELHIMTMFEKGAVDNEILEWRKLIGDAITSAINTATAARKALDNPSPMLVNSSSSFSAVTPISPTPKVRNDQ